MKKVIITGSSKGIGKAITRRLLDEGFAVVGISRKQVNVDPQFYPIHLDLSSLAQSIDRFSTLTKEHGDAEVIICNAGKGLFGSLEQFSPVQMLETIHTNLLSHIFLIRSFIPLFKKRKSGKIIFIGSEASLEGKRNGTIYCATKFGIRGFAQALRDECSNHHIQVTTINPGMISTSFFDDLHFEPGSDSSEHLKEEDIANLISMILQARPGTVFDEINLSPQKKKIHFKK